MIAASRRHAWPAVGLALAAALPVWIHAIADPVRETCAGAERLATLDRFAGIRAVRRPPGPDPARGELALGGSARPATPDVFDLSFLVHRSFEPSRFYGAKPARSFGSSYFIDQPARRVALETDGETLPVWWIEGAHEGIFRLRAHVAVHDLRPVASPFLSGASRAFSQLVSGTLPVTLLVFRAEGAQPEAEAIREIAREWLRGAWRDYRRLCAPDPGAAS